LVDSIESSSYIHFNTVLRCRPRHSDIILTSSVTTEIGILAYYIIKRNGPEVQMCIEPQFQSNCLLFWPEDVSIFIKIR